MLFLSYLFVFLMQTWEGALNLEADHIPQDLELCFLIMSRMKLLTPANNATLEVEGQCI